MPRKGKFYPLLQDEREEMREFIQEQLYKRYIRLSNSTSILCDSKKHIIQNYSVTVTITTLYSTDFFLVFNITWTCIGVCFIID